MIFIDYLSFMNLSVVIFVVYDDQVRFVVA